jgi:hypothetical protein
VTAPSRMLPAEFADLEPFAARWSLATEPERWAQRQTSSIESMRELYDAVFPRYEAVLAYCARFPLGDLPEDARNLLYLVFSFVMVSFPVEVWNGPRIPDAGYATLERVASPFR